MFLVLRRDWAITNGATHQPATIPAGEHAVERVRNPFGHAAPWLVLKGTLIGACEGFWRDWEQDDGEFRVRIAYDLPEAPDATPCRALDPPTPHRPGRGQGGRDRHLLVLAGALRESPGRVPPSGGAGA